MHINRSGQQHNKYYKIVDFKNCDAKKHNKVHTRKLNYKRANPNTYNLLVDVWDMNVKIQFKIL